MTTTDATWREGILHAIERLAGPESAAGVAGEWNEHVARQRIKVTLLGPYSSGKSTLLRRLAVDGGQEVPEWLTVSARRETFELNAVDVHGLTFTDVPGFAAGNELHDSLAQDALALSDAFLLVVPPQLLTTSREFVGSIVSGSYFFGEPRPGVGQTVIAAIAQADAMGIDPEDDVAGMRELADRKERELVAQLEDAAGLSLSDLRVFCVAADPYEEQARQSHPAASSFDPYRSWDGVDALTAALQRLLENFDELRRAAELRYFCRVALAVVADARALLEELEASADELRARQAEWEQHKAKVESVVDAAKAELHTTLVEVASGLEDELGNDQACSRKKVDERLRGAVEQWAQRWDAELGLLIGEVTVQIEDRLNRPRAVRTEEFLRSISTGESRIDGPRPNSRMVDVLSDIRSELQGKAKDAFKAYTGESLDTVLKRDQHSGTASGAPTGRTPAKTGHARLAKMAQVVEGGIQIADAAFAVARIVEEERSQRQLDAEQRRQRREARDQIERSAAKMSVDLVDGTGGEPGWRSRADAAVDALGGQLGISAVDGSADDLHETLREQQQLVAELERLIADSARFDR